MIHGIIKLCLTKNKGNILYTIPQHIMQNQDLSAATKLVYSVIHSYVGEEEKNISYNTIAKNTSLTAMTVMRCVRALQENELIEVTKSVTGWNLYRVISEEETFLSDVYSELF